MNKRISKVAIVLAASAWLIGCASILKEPPELEPVEAVLYYDPHAASIPSAYSVKLPERRMIRQVVIHSIDPIRGTDIYVREKEDIWRLVKEVKSMIDGTTRIDVKAFGDAVRVVPKTELMGVITNVEVFTVRNEPKVGADENK
ncbi:MAG: hypothetical protein OXT74_01660 [Candidatus Poribacteria bacterium]|nr:hypothetical protein [Candidatus Poribacteria bacterium]